MYSLLLFLLSLIENQIKSLVFWYCDNFCDYQMLRLAGSYDHAKTHPGVFRRVIMFGCYTGFSTWYPC